MIVRRRSRADRTPSIPKRPYRDTAILYGVLALVLVVIAALTGGDPARAALVAIVFFVVATAWSWWRFRARIRERARAAETPRGTSENADGNGSQRGG